MCNAQGSHAGWVMVYEVLNGNYAIIGKFAALEGFDGEKSALYHFAHAALQKCLAECKCTT